MRWYVKTECKNTMRHNASLIFHGPMSLSDARMFKLGIEYVDDPSVVSMLVDEIPQDACVRELFTK